MSDEERPWWEQYGIDPTEITAPVEAAVVGDEVAREWIDAASLLILTFGSERVLPFVRGMSQERQAKALALMATMFRRVAAAWEDTLVEAGLIVGADMSDLDHGVYAERLVASADALRNFASAYLDVPRADTSVEERRNLAAADALVQRALGHFT
jgi:hypothetical protein